MGPVRTVQRQNGVALWRQIADRIRVSIAEGRYDETGMVPPEAALAEQFGVNRHTVRAALAALGQEGIVRPVQGRGTLIERRERFNFPISRRTRFTEGIGEQAREIEGILLFSEVEAATIEVAKSLELERLAPVLRIEALRKADGRAVSTSTSWFPMPRFENMGDAYKQTGSITRAFGLCGLEDYVRARTEISAAHAEQSDLAALGLAPGAIVLMTKALNTDLDGVPVQYAVTRFPADRVQLTVTNG
ncbi:phosphonate metabolism transcriptional regulator PhnF [Ciceribacter sp. L1K22]|uniref:phosphonate metabolism transcriptional regulator PhnF n=1 Tax=Ciceribacter sp. L1K22 TaxID=2820275 RepID=UPI001ABEBE71|nr:phosphonate metabolism transcriptional regulator PhnF [Ciceribacter sp. L1K22]MBO3758563.1 phosphonate metabolism transcriptional regulator PhnF [Ciceribacter sp. L1K22]